MKSDREWRPSWVSAIQGFLSQNGAPSWRWIWLLTALILIGVIFWGQTVAASGAAFSAPVIQSTPVAQGATLPADYTTNQSQTNGVILGAVVLVMIVVLGTIATIRRKNS